MNALKKDMCIAIPFSKKQQMRCRFCSGSKCKRCSKLAYLVLASPAIPNLHSSWINHSILAMQRPSDSMLEDGRVLESFVAANITAVFNTTQPGEHPFCGAGILEQTGFPYSPEKLMAVGIKHFNYGWPDMTIPSIHSMMNIVQIAMSEIGSGGKIAIHCHAGFGRTGITIACILIVMNNMDGSAAIQLVRDRRPGSIQTKPQQQFVLDFEVYYRQLRCIFPSAPSSTSTEEEGIMGHSDELVGKTIQQSVMDQQYLLKATERYTDKYRYIHKVMYHISQALSSYRKKKNITTISFMAIIGFSVFRPEVYHDKADDDNDNDAMVHRTVDRWLITPHVLDDRVLDLVRNIKEDINVNRWERFHMMCDVVSFSDCFIASSSSSSEVTTSHPHRFPSFVLVQPTCIQDNQPMSDDISISCNNKLDKKREVSGDNSTSSSSSAVAAIVNGHHPSPSTASMVDDEPILDETTLTSILPTVFSTSNNNQPLLNHTDINQYTHNNNVHHQIKSSSTTKLPYLTPNRSAQQLLDIHSIGSSSVPLFPSLTAANNNNNNYQGNNNSTRSSDNDLRNPLPNRTTTSTALSYDRSAIVGDSNERDDHCDGDGDDAEHLGHTGGAPLALNIHHVPLNESNFGTFNSPVTRPARATSGGVSNHTTATAKEGGGGDREVSSGIYTEANVTSLRDDDVRAISAENSNDDDDEIGDSHSKGHLVNNSRDDGNDGTNKNVSSAQHHSGSNTTSAVNNNNYMNASSHDTTIAVIALSHLLIDWLQSHADELLSTNLIAQLETIWKRAMPPLHNNSNSSSNGSRCSVDVFSEKSSPIRRAEDHLSSARDNNINTSISIINSSISIINMSNIPDIELTRVEVEITQVLRSNLSRYQLQLLDHLVDIYRSRNEYRDDTQEAIITDASMIHRRRRRSSSRRKRSDGDDDDDAGDAGDDDDHAAAHISLSELTTSLAVLRLSIACCEDRRTLRCIVDDK